MREHILDKVQITLNLIGKLSFPITEQSVLENSLNSISMSDKDLYFCKKMLLSSMSENDFPISNTTDAFQKFCVVIGEIKTFRSVVFSGNHILINAFN